MPLLTELGWRKGGVSYIHGAPDRSCAVKPTPRSTENSKEPNVVHKRSKRSRLRNPPVSIGAAPGFPGKTPSARAERSRRSGGWSELDKCG